MPDSDSSARWPVPGEVPPACEAYCALECGLTASDCEARCTANLASTEESYGVACQTAAAKTFACWAGVECDERPAPLLEDCSEALGEQQAACEGDTPVFGGWEPCHLECDRLVDRCYDEFEADLDFTSWDGCFLLCKTNMGFDVAGGCFEVGYEFSNVLAGEPCSQISAHAQDALDAWLDCAEQNGSATQAGPPLVSRCP